MIENTKKISPLKIDAETKKLLIEEQNRFEYGKRPPFGEIVKQALLEWNKKTPQERAARYPSKHDQWHEALEKVLASPDAHAVQCVQQVLVLARRVIDPATYGNPSLTEVAGILDELSQAVTKPEKAREKTQPRGKNRKS